MTARILDIHRSADDASLGATLLRLAQLASVHHAYLAAQSAGTTTAESWHESSTEDGVEGIDSEAELQPPRIRHASGQDRLHREVDR